MVEEERITAKKADAGGGIPAQPRSQPVRRSLVGLTHLLIAKSIAEALLVAALALAFYFITFPPYYRGWGEATSKAVAGWAVNEAAPWERVEVHLYIDGRFVALATANLSRPDVSAAGYAKDEWHGYVFDLPPLEKGEHEARIYARHESAGGRRQTLQLLGKPIPFRVEEEGAQAAPGALKR